MIVTTSWVLTEMADGLAKPSQRGVASPMIERVGRSPQF